MLGLPLDFFQQLIRREDLALVQGVEHPLPIGEQQCVSDIKEERLGWHGFKCIRSAIGDYRAVASDRWLVSGIRTRIDDKHYPLTTSH